MLNRFVKYIALGVLVIAAVSVLFLTLRIVIRLVIFGALALGALWVLRSLRGNSGQGQ